MTDQAEPEQDGTTNSTGAVENGKLIASILPITDIEITAPCMLNARKQIIVIHGTLTLV